MLSIKQDWSIKDIEDDFAGITTEAEQFAIDTLITAGKSFVDKARAKTKEDGGFGNITWNLRASIGFVLQYDHEIIFTYFPPLGKGQEGTQKGIAYANQIAAMFDDGGLLLCCVAGMEYAAFLEATDNDVISGSCSEFEKEFKALTS